MDLVIKKKYLFIKAQENLQKLRRKNIDITTLFSMILEKILTENIYPEKVAWQYFFLFQRQFLGLLPFF